MFLLNWILQNIFLLKPNMYIGNIPLAFLSFQTGDSTSFHPGIQHSELHLCAPESEIPAPSSFRRFREGSPEYFQYWLGSSLCRSQEPQEQEGSQGQDSASGMLRAVLPHLSAPLKHKYMNQRQDHSYKAYFKGKPDPGQELQHKRVLKNMENKKTQKFILKLLRKKINIAQLWHLTEEAF